MKKTSDYKSFAYLENGEIVFSQYETIKSSNKLDSGSYKITYESHPKYEVILKNNNDCETVKVHDFADKEKLDRLFDSFFNKDIFKKITKLGFCHKTGVLLHGIEGTGKSTIIKYYCHNAIKQHKAIVFHVLYIEREITHCWDFIQNIRRIQDNPIIVVFDEFDQFIETKGNEAFLKTVIDGNMSINNCIFLAATNYLNRIPESMSKRPSRFKYCLRIEGMQVVSDIEEILKPMLSDHVSSKEIHEIANKLKGSSLDNIKQYCFDKIMSLNHYEGKNKPVGFNNKPIKEIKKI